MIALRPATIDDLHTLQYWDQQPHVIASDPNDDWEWEKELGRDPAWRQQLIAELDGKAIGFVQIIDPAREESHYWGTIADGYRAIDIWIGEKENLNKGYGSEMMRLAIDRCFAESEVQAIIIDPLVTNEKAHRFYERMGFTFLEERTLGEDRCSVYILQKDQWK